MRGIRFGLAVVVSSACVAALPATSASAATKHTISIAANSSTRQAGHPITISGTVSPNAHGQSIALQQRRPNNAWATVKTMTIGSDSSYRFNRFLNATGVFQFRAKFGTFVSKVKTVTVYRWHYLSDLVPATTSSGGCITNGSAQIRSLTYQHTVSMDLTCGSDISANWNLTPGCRYFHSIVFFTNASSGDAKATLSISVNGQVLDALTVAETDFDAPGLSEVVGGHQALRLEANAPSGTTPIAAWGDAAVDCPW
jgi:hypothetical protein